MKKLRTIPFGILKKSSPREENLIRVTKTLIVTDKGRYDKTTGMPVDYFNKRIGAYKISELDLKKLGT